MTSKKTSRRRFIQSASLLAGAWAAACRTQTAGAGPAPGFEHPLGVQLYTLRDQIQQDADAALEAVARIGYRHVEVLSQMMPGIAPLLAEHGLTPVSGHFPLPLITGSDRHWPPETRGGLESWEQAVELAAEHGLSQMVIAYVQAQERTTLDFYRSLADRMNQAGARCKAAGLQLAYHHHSFEFEPLEGEVPFELLAARFDPQLVHWQLDVFWLAASNLDPVEALRRFSGRVPSLHLKDRAPDAAHTYQESEVEADDFREVGSGALNFPAILKTAGEIGVRYYFVEQDQTPGDPLDSLTKSYQYLSNLKI